MLRCINAQFCASLSDDTLMNPRNSASRVSGRVASLPKNSLPTMCGSGAMGATTAAEVLLLLASTMQSSDCGAERASRPLP
ncbi:hypothetical protein GGH13_000215, partial [Coemansia sp. S155-1]